MKIETLEVAGILSAIRGARNPMNSWDRSDSFKLKGEVYIGTNDLDLAQRLIKAGNEHCKFLRQIQVWFNADMPRYWWSEMDTYKYNTKNSCSTMHKLFNKQSPIMLDMFTYCEEDRGLMEIVIFRLNEIRDLYLNETDYMKKNYLLLRGKRLLAEGFLQLRTVCSNYAEIRNIYIQRYRHRLKEEWIDTFCTWVESLPYAAELILYGIKDQGAA